MYVDENYLSNQSTPGTPPTNNITDSAHSLTCNLVNKAPVNQPAGFRPIEWAPTSSRVQESPRTTHFQAIQMLGVTKYHRISYMKAYTVNIMNPGTLTTNVITTTSPQTQVPFTPVSFVSTTQVRMDVAIPPTVNPTVPTASPARVPLSQITSVASTRNILPPVQPQ